MNDLAERIQRRLKRLGLKSARASVDAGLGRDFIRDVVRGQKASISGPHAVALARVLRCNVDWLLQGAGDEEPEEESLTDASPTETGVRFGGIVEAGAFRGYDGLDQTAVDRIIPIAPDPRYPADAQFAYQVVGDSMEKAGIIEGMWVLAVDVFAWEKLHGEPGDGKLVVVSRVREGRPERELTVKRLRIFRDRIELRPESGNPRHMPFVATAPLVAGDVEWIIQAVVLSSTWLFV